MFHKLHKNQLIKHRWILMYVEQHIGIFNENYI